MCLNTSFSDDNSLSRATFYQNPFWKQHDASQGVLVCSHENVFIRSTGKSQLPGKLKLWRLQFVLLLWLLWPLTGFDAPASKGQSLERMISWEPHAASALHIWRKDFGSISSSTEEFKHTEARLEMILSLRMQSGTGSAGGGTTYKYCGAEAKRVVEEWTGPRAVFMGHVNISCEENNGCKGDLKVITYRKETHNWRQTGLH